MIPFPTLPKNCHALPSQLSHHPQCSTAKSSEYRKPKRLSNAAPVVSQDLRLTDQTLQDPQLAVLHDHPEETCSKRTCTTTQLIPGARGKAAVQKSTTHLKWSCKDTLKSKASPRSVKPMPINALRPSKEMEGVIVGALQIDPCPFTPKSSCFS